MTPGKGRGRPEQETASTNNQHSQDNRHGGSRPTAPLRRRCARCGRDAGGSPLWSPDGELCRHCADRVPSPIRRAWARRAAQCCATGTGGDAA
jgi:hypothetical protein